MSDKLLLEDRPQQIAKERDARLHVDVKLTFGDVEQVMLRGISKTIDGLQDQGLFVPQELDAAVAEGPADASVKADRLLRAVLANSPAAVEDGSLQQHLERMIELNQRAAHTPAVVWTVEQLDAQDERVACL
jgi:hypothetical protein